MTKRSLLLISSFLHPRGGDTTLLFDEWDAYRAHGVNVIPFAMRHPDNVTVAAETRFPSWHAPRSATTPVGRVFALGRSIWNREAARALDSLLTHLPPSQKPRAAHIHHLVRHLTPAILPVLRRHGVRVVWTLHDYEWACPTGLRFREEKPCDRCIGGQYRHAIAGKCKDGSQLASAAVAVEKYVHRRIGVERWVDLFVAPSQALADVLVADGIPPNRVVHVPNFLASVPAPATRDRAGVVFAGRLTREKGAHLVVAAARHLPTVDFDMIGDGPERALLASQAPKNVTFKGNRDRSEVQNRLASAQIAVVPSLWPENHPYAVIEAQAAGCAVVASRIGGIPEMILHDHDGLLVPPNDQDALIRALRALSTDENLRGRLGKAAFQRVKEADASRWLAAMDALLWPLASDAQRP